MKFLLIIIVTILLIAVNLYPQKLEKLQITKISFYSDLNCQKDEKEIKLPHTILKPFEIINGCYKIYTKKIKGDWIIIGKIKTASVVYFNDLKVSESGVIGKKFLEDYKKMIFFKIPEKLNKMENIITIKFQSTDLDGGFYYPVLETGNVNAVINFINKENNVSTISEAIIIGIFSFVFLFLTFLYFNKITDPEYYSFGIFTLFYVLYYFFNSSFIVNSSVNNFFTQKLKFSFFMTAPIFFLKFCFDVFKIEKNNFYKTINITNIITIALFLLICNSIYSFKFFKIVSAFILFIYILYIVFIAYKGYKYSEYEELRFASFGIFLYIVLILIEIFNGMEIEISDWGALILTMFCSYALTLRFARINKDLDMFSSKLLKIRDEERKRLGKDLHDGLGQNLLAIKLKIQLHNKKAGIFSDVVNDITNAIEDMRNICEELNPSLLENLGLKEAIEETLKKCSKYFPIKINYEVDEIDIPYNISEQIFRIFQECLTNAIKHSKASNLFFKLKKSNSNIIFQIIDNGIGFIPSKIKRGIGILSIKERVNKLKGEYKIISAPNKGTEIWIRIPWKK